MYVCAPAMSADPSAQSKDDAKMTGRRPNLWLQTLLLTAPTIAPTMAADTTLSLSKALKLNTRGLLISTSAPEITP